MALIKCPECGRDISDKAKACIHCGYPIPKVQERPVPTEPEQAKAAPVVEGPAPVEEQSVNAEPDAVEQKVEPISSLAEPSEEKPARPPMSNKQKAIICISVLAVVMVSVLIWSAVNSHNQKMRQQRDLSNAFGFSFSWTMDEVIEYEAKTYGNTEYEYDAEVNRLDFERYDADHWKHRYFFDDNGILENVSYMDAIVGHRTEGSQCEHSKPIKKALLNIIGEWDSSSNSDLFYYAIGQVDGVNVKVQYETGTFEGISIRRVDE